MGFDESMANVKITNPAHSKSHGAASITGSSPNAWKASRKTKIKTDVRGIDGYVAYQSDLLDTNLAKCYSVAYIALLRR